jgi:hypothetical protein
MTAPAGLLDPGIVATVWIDGTRLADTGAELAAGTPTVLSGVAVVWGRSTTVDQPGPATCSFTVSDQPGGSGFLDVVTVGRRVDLFATGHLYTDAAGTEILTDPGFEAVPVGARPVCATPATTSAIASTAAKHGGTRSVVLTPTGGADYSTPLSITIPPAPFGASGDRTAWDHIPATSPGAPWQLSAWVKAPAGASVTLTPTIYSAPFASVGQPGAGAFTLTADGSWQQLASTYWATAGGRWVGLTVTVTDLPRWLDLPRDMSWAQTPGAWVDYGRWFLDDCSISTSAEVTTRTVLVFTGRVTDVEARWHDRRLSIDVTAADPLAELQNTVIGDDPWAEETLGARVSKILTLAGGQYPAVVDQPAASRLVTYRDVDAQATAGMLAELAASADAVAWLATHATAAGPYVWIEDVAGRGALYVLSLDPGTGLVVIGPIADAGVFTELSACRVLRDPVRWVQQVSDVSTVVDVVWREQTLDEQGQQRPTDRHVTLTDPAARAAYGTRRVGLQTQLSREPDAVAVAEQLFARLTVAEWRISGLAWDTAVGEDFTDDDMTLSLDLLDGQARLGHPLMVVDLPEWSPKVGGRVPCYVEGGTYTFDGGRWVLDFKVSSATATGSAVAWNELDRSWSWQEFDRAISWADLNGVSVP